MVDRYEGQKLICLDEENEIVLIGENEIKERVASGTTLIEQNDGTFLVDKADTEKRKKRIRKLMGKLFQ